jgi:hypothetical protein
MSVFSKVGGRGFNEIMTIEEAQSIINDLNEKSLIEYNKKNPKRAGSKAAMRYSQYCNSKTVAEFIENGGTGGDFKYDLMRGFVKVK